VKRESNLNRLNPVKFQRNSLSHQGRGLCLPLCRTTKIKNLSRRVVKTVASSGTWSEHTVQLRKWPNTLLRAGETSNKTTILLKLQKSINLSSSIRLSPRNTKDHFHPNTPRKVFTTPISQRFIDLIELLLPRQLK
jgi:hypothetical protein